MDIRPKSAHLESNTFSPMTRTFWAQKESDTEFRTPNSAPNSEFR